MRARDDLLRWVTGEADALARRSAAAETAAGRQAERGTVDGAPVRRVHVEVDEARRGRGRLDREAALLHLRRGAGRRPDRERPERVGTGEELLRPGERLREPPRRPRGERTAPGRRLVQARDAERERDERGRGRRRTELPLELRLPRVAGGEEA